MEGYRIELLNEEGPGPALSVNVDIELEWFDEGRGKFGITDLIIGKVHVYKWEDEGSKFRFVKTFLLDDLRYENRQWVEDLVESYVDRNEEKIVEELTRREYEDY